MLYSWLTHVDRRLSPPDSADGTRIDDRFRLSGGSLEIETRVSYGAVTLQLMRNVRRRMKFLSRTLENIGKSCHLSSEIIFSAY